MNTLGPIGGPRAMAHEPPLDPPDEIDDSGEFDTFDLPLGDATVTVCYSSPHGAVQIEGAYIGDDFADASEFSRSRLEAWSKELQRRVDNDIEDSRDECARAAWEAAA